jgi:hypothetical protein
LTRRSAGWVARRGDAATNLKAITLPEPDDSGRGAWTRNEILKALTNLEPGSWSAWLYLLSLTTGRGARPRNSLSWPRRRRHR